MKIYKIGEMIDDRLMVVRKSGKENRVVVSDIWDGDMSLIDGQLLNEMDIENVASVIIRAINKQLNLEDYYSKDDLKDVKQIVECYLNEFRF